jgi:hypothetical protein
MKCGSSCGCPAGSGLVGGVVVWLAGHAHLSCLNLRQWITIGVDMHSFIHAGSVCVSGTCSCA